MSLILNLTSPWLYCRKLERGEQQSFVSFSRALGGKKQKRRKKKNRKKNRKKTGGNKNKYLCHCFFAPVGSVTLFPWDITAAGHNTATHRWFGIGNVFLGQVARKRSFRIFVNLRS